MTGINDKFIVPHDFVSDGCSVPRMLRGLYARYTDDCRWHDWARRHLVHYGVISVQQADAELRRRWKTKTEKRGAMPAWLAQISWLIVKLTRDRYNTTLPVPRQEWLKYVYPEEG